MLVSRAFLRTSRSATRATAVAKSRPWSPQKTPSVIDSTATPIEDVFALVMQKVKEKGLIEG